MTRKKNTQKLNKSSNNEAWHGTAQRQNDIDDGQNSIFYCEENRKKYNRNVTSCSTTIFAANTRIATNDFTTNEQDRGEAKKKSAEMRGKRER